MTQYRQVPVFEQPMVIGNEEKVTNAQWYRYFQSHDQGQPPGNESVVVPPASPFTYSAKRKGFLIVNGGTVSALQISRSGTFYGAGQTSGTFTLAQNDQVKFTYTVAPQIVFFPI